MIIGLGNAVFGQQNLLKSRHSSEHVYYFRLTNKQAKEIYQSEEPLEFDEAYLRQFVDSFVVSPEYDLPPGHYLVTDVVGDHLEFEVESVQYFQTYILNNHQDFCLQLVDTSGQIIENAKVKLDGIRVRFDQDSKSYRINKANRKGLLEVKLGEVAYYDQVDRLYDRNLPNRLGLGYVHYGVTKYVWSPVRYIVNAPGEVLREAIQYRHVSYFWRVGDFFSRLYEKVVCIFDDSYCDRGYYQNRDKYDGYLAFNKPIYRPGDTLFWKAFIIEKETGDLMELPLQLNFNQSYGQKFRGEVRPQYPGNYNGFFVLNDSLDLKLDADLQIILSTNGYYLRSLPIKYEDYELTQARLEVNGGHDAYFPGDSIILLIKGTDDNELPLADGQLEVFGKISKAHAYKADSVFIPDTLFYRELDLEPWKETEVSISTVTFPKADFDYEITVTLTTSDNTVKRQTLRHTYHIFKEKIEYELKEDSIHFTFWRNGEMEEQAGSITILDPFGHTLSEQQVDFPYGTKINPYAWSYQIRTNSGLWKRVTLSKEEAGIQLESSRLQDSLWVRFKNPHHIPINYFLYANKKELGAGFGQDIHLAEAIPQAKQVWLTVQYLWSGEMVEEDYSIPLSENRLFITTNQLPVVYPGQKQEVEIMVTDKNGEAVPDVDLTAYAYTKKFPNEVVPTVPTYQKPTKPRKVFNEFTLEDRKVKEGAQELDFPFWKDFARLDQIEYYHFLYPKDSIYTFVYTPSDSLTQFAPYVSIAPVHVILVDKRPVYFSWTTHPQTYSFSIDRGYHEIRLRTDDKLITIDSMYFPFGKKTIFSLSDTLVQKGVHIEAAPTSLSEAEKKVYYRYLFPYRKASTQLPYFIEQKDNFLSLGPTSGSYGWYNRKPGLAGPVYHRPTKFSLATKYELEFSHEPNFEYEFLPNLLKMRQVKMEDLFTGQLGRQRVESLPDLVLTKEKVLAEATLNPPNYRSQFKIRSSSQMLKPLRPGRLKLGFDRKVSLNLSKVLAHILLRPEDETFYQLYPANNLATNGLQPGIYSWVIVYEDERYSIIDSLEVLPHGFNYYKIDYLDKLEKDSFLTKVIDLIQEDGGYAQPESTTETQSIPQKIEERFFYSTEENWVEGTVTDDLGEPLIGATILVAGTTIGTVTDIDGNYGFYVPADASEIIISYTGFSSQSIPLSTGPYQNVALATSAEMLEEVVVTGLGTARASSNLSAAVTTVDASEVPQLLQGRAAGVEITGAPGLNLSTITLRGIASIDMSQNPLLVVDGVIFSGSIAELDPYKIKEITILKDVAATSVYGSKAANGVLLITTSAGSFRPKILGAEDPFDREFSEIGNSIRSNFQDYAYWEPTLVTNAEGKATFEVTYPDDVTNWNTYVLAMNNKKQSGQISGSVKSYKPVMAQLNVPRFLIEGDETQLIGKSLNYTSDSIDVETRFEIDGAEKSMLSHNLAAGVVDSLILKAEGLDTIAAKYYLTQDNGYQDGEIREIPVFRKGTTKTEGAFYAFRKDTNLLVSDFDPDLPLQINVDGNLIQSLQYEIRSLKSYQYLCNEQTASILMAFLMEKKIKKYLDEPFDNMEDVNKLIRKLEKNQNNSGGWGWWNKSSTVDWITNHVTSVLLVAKEEGFAIPELRYQIDMDDKIWLLEGENKGIGILTVLERLQMLGENLDYKRYLDRIESENDLLLYDFLRVQRIRKKASLPVAMDSILQYKRTDVFGNVYFEKRGENLGWWPQWSRAQNTILAISVLQGESDYQEVVERAIAYLLQNRYHINTYSKASLLSVVLPPLLGDNKKVDSSLLKIEGIADIDRFPFDTVLTGVKQLSIQKMGDLPLFFSYSQKRWQKEVSRKEDLFEISTSFSNGTDSLEGGKSVALQVTLTVKKEAPYVMLEVPIPAGCSYNSKKQGSYPEVHREYYKNYVALFFNKLSEGTYHFEIDLLPRYTGTYHLNPARAELMYFPVFNGNNEGKTVKVNGLK